MQYLLGIDSGGQWELDLTNVSHGDRIRPTRCLYRGTKGLDVTILDVNAHFERRIVWSVPHLNVSIEWAPVCAKSDMYPLHVWGTK